MVERRRVVVTGLGAVTPLGIGASAFWQELLAGTSGIRRISRFDPEGFASQIAGEVQHFDPLAYMDRKDVLRTDLFIQYALAAALLAVQDADLRMDGEDRDRVGVYVGTGMGGIATLTKGHRVLLDQGPNHGSPYTLPALLPNMAAGWISMRLGARGPNGCVSTACAAGSHAVGDAARLIQHGEADVMIAGGAEALITPLVIEGFTALRALSTRNDEPGRASRPFDKDRDGFVLGEGAGIVVLEERERARARGAAAYAELAGYGRSADAHHPTNPSPDGAARAMAAALRDAGLRPEDVDYINAHATSTRNGDTAETQSIKRVFGEHAYRLAVSSTKSMTGHLLGAAGGVEAIATVLSVRHGLVPPTINCDAADPDCDLDYVPNRSRTTAVRAALSNSFAFGGTNAVLAFTRSDIG
jgi:3-oxoacyl-[acyl-carrier-protein] synthase II